MTDPYMVVALCFSGLVTLVSLMKVSKLEIIVSDLEQKIKAEKEQSTTEKAEQNEKMQDLLEEFEAVKNRLRVKKQK